MDNPVLIEQYEFGLLDMAKRMRHDGIRLAAIAFIFAQVARRLEIQDLAEAALAHPSQE